MGTDKEWNLYLLDAVAGRFLPDATLDILFDLHRKWTFKVLGIETTAFQRMLAQDLRRRLWEERQKRQLFSAFHIEEFTGVTQKMRICREEIFGPVLGVSTYRTIDEAIRKANDVDYGLAASVYGKDIATAMKIANALHFGTVWINEHGALASEMPHGGYKQSGFGKDLSLYSMEEYTQIKHVYIDLSSKARKSWHYVVYGEPG